jgi:hypothetical protein
MLELQNQSKSNQKRHSDNIRIGECSGVLSALYELHNFLANGKYRDQPIPPKLTGITSGGKLEVS